MIHLFTQDCLASVLEDINHYWHCSSNNLKHRIAHVTFTNAAISAKSFLQAVVTKPRKATCVALLACRRVCCLNKARSLYDLILIDYSGFFITFYVPFFFLSFFPSSFNYSFLSWFYFHDTVLFHSFSNKIIKLCFLQLIGQLRISIGNLQYGFSQTCIVWDTENVVK